MVPIGKAHKNPLLDTRRYEAELSDGYSEIITTHIISGNLLSQVDNESYHQNILENISDHWALKDAVQPDLWNICYWRGTVTKSKNYQWMGVIRHMEGRIWRMDSPGRPEILLSIRDGGLCHPERYRIATYLCVVGTLDYKEEEDNIVKSKD